MSVGYCFCDRQRGLEGAAGAGTSASPAAAGAGSAGAPSYAEETAAGGSARSEEFDDDIPF